MFLLLSLTLALATAEVEVCGPAHCDKNCVAGQKCTKIKKIACEEEDPSKGKNDECCNSFSCSGKQLLTSSVKPKLSWTELALI